MSKTIAAQDIQELEVYKTFDKLEKFMIIKSFNMKVINQGLIVYRSSKQIDPRVTGKNLKVLKELIEKENKT